MNSSSKKWFLYFLLHLTQKIFPWRSCYNVLTLGRNKTHIISIGSSTPTATSIHRNVRRYDNRNEATSRYRITVNTVSAKKIIADTRREDWPSRRNVERCTSELRNARSMSKTNKIPLCNIKMLSNVELASEQQKEKDTYCSFCKINILLSLNGYNVDAQITNNSSQENSCLLVYLV